MIGISKIFKSLYKFEAVTATSAYGILAITIMIDVIAREVLSIPILGTQRFAVYMSIIAGFLGVCLAAAAGAHLRPRIADSWLPRKWDSQVNRLSNLVASVIFGVAGYFAYQFWNTGFSMGDTAPVLGWPLWPIQIIIPYAFFSTAFRFFMFAFFPELVLVNDTKEDEL